ncbi:MAG: hypothetical protein ACOYT4_02305 [Nanoarchaeota archaeon]
MILKNLKKFTINVDVIVEDIELGYLSKQKYAYKRTPFQKLIELNIYGNLIEIPNKKKFYKQQFYEGHASKGGRIIDVESHIAKKGEYKGRLVHFGQPANSRYLWVVTEEEEFILGNRQTFLHEMNQMNKEKIDYFHRLHKLPHATVAMGKRVYGSGEALVEGGLRKAYNSASCHYIDFNDVIMFNEQSKYVFMHFANKAGWKSVNGGAKFEMPYAK